MQTGLSELCVGISEFIAPENTYKKIKGIIKARYSDFNVNEIAKDGNVIHLSDLGPGISWQSIQDHISSKKLKNSKSAEVCSAPLTDLLEDEEADVHSKLTLSLPMAEILPVPSSQVDNDSVEKPSENVITEEIRAFVTSFITATFREDAPVIIAGLLELAEKKRLAGESFLVLPSVVDKQERTTIHNFFKDISSKVNGVLVTDTIEKDRIRVSYRFPNSRKRKQEFDDRNHLDTKKAEKRNDFILCHLYKENKDTMECSSRIAAALRISTKDISYAGTKDRRGITVQQLAISTKGGMTIDRVAGLNKHLGPGQGIYLGNFRYGPSSYGLGDLSGNYFQIVLRDVKPVDASVFDKRDEFIDQLKKQLGREGFINFYGMQRFGQSKICPTYRIGIAVMRNDWKTAVDLIMDPRENETDAIEEARVLWKVTKQVKKALNMIPRRWVAERSILHYFSLPGISMTDCLGAFQRIPHELRLMYLHSFQSLIWNKIASYRIATFGKSPVIGDFVFSVPSCGDTSGDVAIVALQSADDCQKHTLDEVVIPLPGYSVQYPPHLLPAYRQFVSEYGIEFDTFGKFGKQASITLAGSYRKLICIPKDFDAEFIEYVDPNEALLKNDLDCNIRNQPTAQNCEKASVPEQDEIPNGNPVVDAMPYLALKVSFSLPSSAYATMALREFLRIDTGAAFQRSLCPLPPSKST